MSTESRPAQPKSILRGHKAQVHAAAFVFANERLVTGDADGFVISWDLTIMRPRAVWRAHTNSILGISDWGRDRLITHGRDNKLIVWKLGVEDESRLSTSPPLDPVSRTRPQPEMLHLLEVNTMNFCSFSHCPEVPASGTSSGDILVAVPNTLASEAIDIYHLPSQNRKYTLKLGEKNGMVMALSLLWLGQTLTLVAGYENGLALVAQLDDQGNWLVIYQAKPHTQPILSLDVSPSRDYFITSSADAIIAKHSLSVGSQQPGKQPVPPRAEPTQEIPIPQKPALRNDDSNRPPETKPPTKPAHNDTNKPKSLLSAALANEPRSPPVSQLTPSSISPSFSTPSPLNNNTPIKQINTKHAGQQSLRIRSDGRIFATAGWDSRIRVYSTRTLREVAVLKWHGLGCYAVTFAAVGTDANANSSDGDSAECARKSSVSESGPEEEVIKGDKISKHKEPRSQQDLDECGVDRSNSVAVVPKLVEVTVREKRVHQAMAAHWIAAGSKDGKISLWDVF